MAKNSNRNIRAFCQRKWSDVAWVCTRRANACGVTAVTVSTASVCKFSRLQAMHLNPNACTTAGPDARIGMICCFLAICAFKLKMIWSEKCDGNCPSVHTYICNILKNRMCIEHIFRSHMMQSRYLHAAAFMGTCNWKIENKSIQPTSGLFCQSFNQSQR